MRISVFRRWSESDKLFQSWRNAKCRGTRPGRIGPVDARPISPGSNRTLGLSQSQNFPGSRQFNQLAIGDPSKLGFNLRECLAADVPTLDVESGDERGLGKILAL